MTIECVRCGNVVETAAAFEAHDPTCVCRPLVNHPLEWMSVTHDIQTGELKAHYRGKNVGEKLTPKRKGPKREPKASAEPAEPEPVIERPPPGVRRKRPAPAPKRL